jgi:hypothetical protein
MQTRAAIAVISTTTNHIHEASRCHRSLVGGLTLIATATAHTTVQKPSGKYAKYLCKINVCIPMEDDTVKINANMY